MILLTLVNTTDQCEPNCYDTAINIKETSSSVGASWKAHRKENRQGPIYGLRHRILKYEKKTCNVNNGRDQDHNQPALP